MDKTETLSFRCILLWLLILGLLAGLYLPSLDFDLFADDFGFYGHKELGSALVDYFLKGGRPSISPGGSTYFRPLSDYVWALKFALFGTGLDYYHAVAVLVHLINTVLVSVLARKLLGLNRVWSLCASLLFAVFWFNFEAVAWLAANDTAICTAFLLSAVLFSFRYVRQGGIGALFALSLSMLLAIASKEFALIMPFVVGLIWFLPFERPAKGARRRILIALAISSALVAGYMMLRHALAFRTEIPQSTFGFLLKTGHGLATLLWCPVGYGFIGVLSAMFILLSLFWIKTRVLALIVLAMLSPGFLQGPQMRYGYPASAAFALMLGVVLKAFGERPRPKIASALIGLLVALAGGTLYAFVKQDGPSPVFVLGGLALALALLLLGWRKGRLQASSVVGFVLVALIAAGHFGLAMDFPFPCKSGGKESRLAESIVAQLPPGNTPLTIVGTKSEFNVEGEAIGIGYARGIATIVTGRELRFDLAEDVLQKIAESPDTRLDNIVVIGQTDGQITRRDDVKTLFGARQASYLMPSPDMLSFAFNGPPDQSGARFAACDVDHKAVGRLEMIDNPLDTVAYDLISVGYLHPNQLPSQFAWLEWYGCGNESPLGRVVKKIEAGQATFLLRRQLDWLTARKVTRITTGFVDGDAIPFLGAMCIRKQPLVRKLRPESGLPTLKPAVDLQSLKRSGAVPNDN
ncbi:glycosyltransferase family 39 protein [bacterium]|nr:glycosyltransferase family 39 protein [bacterium]